MTVVHPGMLCRAETLPLDFGGVSCVSAAFLTTMDLLSPSPPPLPLAGHRSSPSWTSAHPTTPPLPQWESGCTPSRWAVTKRDSGAPDSPPSAECGRSPQSMSSKQGNVLSVSEIQTVSVTRINLSQILKLQTGSSGLPASNQWENLICSCSCLDAHQT